MGLPGHAAFLLEIETSAGESFRGFEATITGAVNQANPFGILPTIFTDNNALFEFDPSVDASQDSQFLFNSGDVLSIGAEEGDGLLKGAFQGLASLNLPNPVSFVQIVTDDAEAVGVDLSIDIGLPEAFILRGGLLPFGAPILDAGLSITSTPAPGLPGFRTYTVSLERSDGFSLGAYVQAAFDGAVFQAAGDATPFVSDLELGQSPSDSHFLIERDAVVANDASAEIDDGLGLAGFFSVDPSTIAPLPLAQITTDDPANVTYEIEMGVPGIRPVAIFRGALIPEPSTALLVACALVAGCSPRGGAAR